MKYIIAIILNIFITISLMARATDISQEEMLKMQITDKEMILLDVRTPAEFSQGHIKGAINITHTDIQSMLKELPKDKKVVLYCRSGRRAGVVANILAPKGYNNLYHLDGDMILWNANKRPVITKE